ncbi:MAG: GGDEF domain-containing protein [Coriobacteriales bacterium]|nr:GGDEF domain-containing protein [Coriobacteriales bacterium]
MAKTNAGRAKYVPAAHAGRLRKSALLTASALLALVLATTIALTIRNNNNLGDILEESVKSELLAICFAARDDVSVDLFLSINSEDDFYAHQSEIDETIERLRVLKNEVGATYIYALKKIDGTCYFILDTDEEAGTPDNPIFTEYDIAPVHAEAFAGRPSADIMNVEDEWGSYNTGAIPLYREGDSGEIIGVISVDFEDAYIARSRDTAMANALLLTVVMAVTMAVLLGLLVILFRRNRKMEEDLLFVANHDAITNLYNRYYLFTYLAGWSKSRHSVGASFAILFIDLDNFKRVNDSAGHDEGDVLLRLISRFFQAYSDTDETGGDIENITARIGGDEFVQVIPGIATPEEAERRARAMLEDFIERPEFQRYIKDFDIGLSIGGALYPSQAVEYSELIRFADIAMYQAKYSGKNTYFLYDESMGDGPEGAVLSVRANPR